MNHQANCFVDMPFGKKTDMTSGIVINFDAIFSQAIKPAIEKVGLKAERGDIEKSGGIIHLPMFARILLSDFMVADLTLGNPNVFYELGIRHLAKPFTTIPIYATTSALPFDLNMVRSIPYALEQGKLTSEAADKLCTAITARLRQAIEHAAQIDSPIYDLISALPPLQVPQSVAQTLSDRMDAQDNFRDAVLQARAQASDAQRSEALQRLEESLGEIGAVRRSVLLELMIAYREVRAYDEMVRLCERFPDDLRQNPFVRQQWALGLNRRRAIGDQDRAAEMLITLVRSRGPDPETLGLLGRIHKDRYKTERDSPAAGGHLVASIKAYTEGFQADPRDYYPGINAVTLLIHRGSKQSLKEADELIPIVEFALKRSGTQTAGYWNLATLLELACCKQDWEKAENLLDETLAAAKASFEAETTAANLQLLLEGFVRANRPVPELDVIVEKFAARVAELSGAKKEAPVKPG
jgi:hypothetical protein